MTVDVYWNLHKQCFSVRDTRTGLVVEHSDGLCLRDAHFKVSEAGRQRVLRERRKNVHAVIRGTRCRPRSVTGPQVTYNPYKAPSFVDAANRPVMEAGFVQLGTVDGRPRIVINDANSHVCKENNNGANL